MFGTKLSENPARKDHIINSAKALEGFMGHIFVVGLSMPISLKCGKTLPSTNPD